MLRRSSRLFPLAFALALFACQDNPSVTGPEDDDTRFGDGSGFTLLLTDAPGDFEAAVVTISKVTLNGSGQPIVLLDEPFTGDLLDLRSQVATLVEGFDVPAGSYSQLRLIVDGAYIEVETANGTEIFASSPDYEGLPDGAQVDGTLQLPSMGTSGLKIDLPGGKLEIGEGETIVLLDFDVEESFGHEAGKSGKWVMHPVIKATNATFGGFVTARLQLGEGVVLPELAGQLVTLGAFKATLTPAAGGTTREILLTDTNADGIFEAMFKGVAPGQYTLTFVGPAGLVVSFAPVLPLTVTVAANQTATQLVTLSTVALPGSVVATLKLGTNVTLPPVGEAATTLAQFRAQLTPTGGTAQTVAFTDANADGTFEAAVPNLAPGQYSLTLLSPTGVTATYDVAVPVAITLAAGATETRPFVVTAATAP